MIAGGAVGNMIDRLKLDYVVDFIYIVLINFPIFNVADMYVTFATAILIIEVLFVYKDNDFNFLSFKQKKFRELK
jgi:signal peptidase II